MQPIERYGLVTLILLAVSATAVLAWDGPKDPKKDDGGATEVSKLDPPAKSERTTPRTDGAKPNTNQNGKAPSGTDTRRGSTASDFGVPGTSGAPTSVPERKSPPPPSNLLGTANDPAPDAGLGANPAGTRPADDRAKRDTPAPWESNGANDPKVQPPAGGGAATQPKGSAPLAAAPPVNGMAPNAGTRNQDAPALPTGELVVRPTAGLSSLLQEEYGKDYRLYGATGLVQAFADANPGLDPGALVVGQKLVRPSATRIAAARKDATAETPTNTTTAANTNAPAGTSAPKEGGPGNGAADAPAPSGRTHTVQPGETLSGIAAAELGDGNAWRRIAALNPSVDPNRLHVGTVLALPVGGAVASATPATKSSTPSTSGSRVK